MDLSKYYRRLIKDWAISIDIDEDTGDTFFYHTAPTFLSIRDEIHDAGLDNHPLVMELDKKAIINAIRSKADPPYDREYEGLDRWWWHFEKIADGTFPAELLPEHLREVYTSTLEKYKNPI
jgi:hypothetical protein